MIKKEKMKSGIFGLVVGMFLFLVLISMASVSALGIGNQTIYNDGCYNYTANRGFNVTSINITGCRQFYIDDVEFCSYVNKSFFNTERICFENVSVINESDDVVSFVNSSGFVNTTGEIIVGTNVSFNVTLFNQTTIDSVWIKIWEDVVGGIVKFVGYLSDFGNNIWSVVVSTNSSFNESEYNYSIYVNTTSGIESSVNGSFNMSGPRISSVVLNASSVDNLTSDNLTAYVNVTPSDSNLSYQWYRGGVNVINTTSGVLPSENTTAGEDWYVNVTPTYGGEIGTTVRSNDITILEILTPIYSNFSANYGTTNFSNYTVLNNLTNVVLGTSYGKINWTSNHLNVEGANYDLNVRVGEIFVSVNTSGLNETHNVSSKISLYNASCDNSVVYYVDGFFDTGRNDIINNGSVCNATTSPACSNFVCSNNILTFTAPHFSSYASNAYANLSVWDQNDEEGSYANLSLEVNESIIFFGNYTNITNGAIESATCNIWFNDSGSWNEMGFNSSINSYNYSREFNVSGVYAYNVSCNKTGFGSLNVEDSIFVNDSVAPYLYDFKPYSNSTYNESYNVSNAIEVSVNVTDNALVEGVEVYANITLPNSTIMRVNLSNSSILVNSVLDKFNESYIIPNLTGRYNITYIAVDLNGNINSSVSSFFVVQDLVVPTLVDFKPYSNLTYNESYNVSSVIEISVNVSDNVEVDSVWINLTLPNGTVDQYNLVNVSVLNNNLSDKYNVSYLVPNVTGRYNITYIANDTSGNINSSETSFFVGEDLIAPYLYDFKPYSNSTYNETKTVNTSVEIAVNVSDNVEVSGIFVNITYPNSTVYRLDLENISIIVNNESDKYNASFMVPFLTGRYNITYIANDTSGNINSSVISFFVGGDGDAPTLVDFKPYSNSTYNETKTVNTSIEISVNVSDNVEVDFVFANVSFPNGTVHGLVLNNVSVLNNSINDKYNASFMVPFLTGRYNITYVANDSSGNINSSVVSFFVSGDGDAPEIEFVNITPLNNSVVSEDIYINVTIYETELANVILDFNGTNMTCFSNLTCDDENLTLVNLTSYDYLLRYNRTGISDGVYRVQAFAEDVSSNINSTSVRQFRADSNSPNVSLISPVNNSFRNINNVTLNCNATNAALSNLTVYVWNSTGEYYINSSNVSGVFNSSIWNLTNISDGNYDWNCRAVDDINLVGWAHENWTFEVDTVKPWLNITSPANSSQVGDPTPDIKFNVSDGLADVLNYSVWINGTSGTFIYDGSGNNGTEVTQTVSDNLDFGNYTFYVNVTDKAGNVNTSSIYQLEVVPPVVYLVEPKFNKSLNHKNISFKFNVTDYIYSNLSCSLYIDDVLNYTNTTTFRNVNTTMNVSGISEGVHNWTVACNNSQVVVNNSAPFIIDVSSPIVNLISPINNKVTLEINQTFRCNVTNSDLVNISLNIWNSTSDSLYYSNSTNISGTSADVSWDVVNMAYEEYDWNCRAMDRAGNIGWASSNYSLAIRNLTSDIILSDLSCSEDSAASWKDCDSFSYGEEITHIRVKASLDIGNISSVKFNLYNVDDNSSYIENASSTYNASNYYVLNSSYDLVDSGNWTLVAYATEEDGNATSTNSSWNFSYGWFNVTLVNPSVNTNVTYHGLFNFNISVGCFGGECDEINLTLDPEEMNVSENETVVENESIEDEIFVNGSFVENESLENVSFVNGSFVENESIVNESLSENETIENSTFVNESSIENTTIENEVVEEVVENNFGIQTGYVGGNYTAGESSFLVVWDSNDIGMLNAVSDSGDSKRVNDNVTFYAEFKNSKNGSVIDNGDCVLVINGTNNSMSYSSGYYSFVKNMTEASEFVYLVSCGHADYSNLSVSDLVAIEVAADNSKGAISSEVGAVPFYTIDDNPMNCTLRGGEVCSLNWRVNATGAINKSYTFFVEGSGSRVSYNKSEEINLTISRTDSVAPVIVWAGATPSAISNGSSVMINANVEDDVQVDSVWGVVTHPSGFNSSFNSVPFNFSNTTETGRYNLTYYANDSFGNNVISTSWFEVAGLINTTINVSVNMSVGMDISGNFTFKLIHHDFGDTIYEIETNGSFVANVPDVVYDIVFLSAFNDSMNLTLRQVNLSVNSNESINLDKYNNTDYPTAYGISTGYLFYVSEIIFSYKGINVSNENNLRLLKCSGSDYNFADRSCISGGWVDVTDNAVLNTEGNYFSYDTKTFSGFGIREVVCGDGRVEASETCDDGNTVSGDGCSNVCQIEVVGSGDSGGWASGTSGGVSEEDEKISNDSDNSAPEQLFDIRMDLEDASIDRSQDLRAVVTYESFGNVPTPVNLTFEVFDSDGKLVYSRDGFIVVRVEEIKRYEFSDLDLADGEYEFVFTTLYNVDVVDEFRQKFVVGREGFDMVYVWWGLGMVVLGLIGWGCLGLRRKKWFVRKKPLPRKTLKERMRIRAVNRASRKIGISDS